MHQLVIELLRIGFHGFAVVMLYLGYRLLRTVVAESASAAPKSVEEITGLKLRLKEVRFFLVISLFFFVIGIASELFQRFQESSKKNEITMQLQPEVASMPDQAFIPTLLEGEGLPIRMNENTSTFKLKVRDGHMIYLQLHTLTEEVKRMRKLLAKEQSKEQENNVEGGLDDAL